MNLMEGFDVGAIMSIYVGLFVLFRAFSEETGLARKTLTAILTEVVVVLFCGLDCRPYHFFPGGNANRGHRRNGAGYGKQRKRAGTRPRSGACPRWKRCAWYSRSLWLSPGPKHHHPDKSRAYWGLVGQDPRIPELKSDDPQVRAKVVAQMA